MSEGKNQTFVKQGVILAVAALLVRFIGFIYRLPLTRMIGDEGNGIYSQAWQIYNFFLILSAAGMPSAISKLVSERVSLGRRDEAHRVFKVALAVSVVLGAVCMGILFFGATPITNAMGNPRSYYSLIALSPTVFIVAIMAVFRGYFMGLGTAVPTSVSQVVEQIFNAVFSVVLAWAFMGLAFEDNLAMGAAGGTAGSGVGAVFGLLAVIVFYYKSKRDINKNAAAAARDNTGQSKQSTAGIVIEIIRTSLPIIIGMAVFSFTSLIDMTMVTNRLQAGGFSANEALSLYGQLSGKYTVIITLPISVATALAAAVIPSISSSKALKDSAAVENKIKTALRLTMLICIPAAVGIGVMGVPIIQMLFGKNQEGGMLLQIGAINIVFMALNQILTGPLQATGNVRIPVIAALFGSAIKILLNYTLVAIPAINVNGAVIGTMCCYIAASFINWRMLRKKTGARLDFIKLMLKPVFSAIIMGVVCFFGYKLLRFMGLGNTVSAVCVIVVGVTVYVVTLMIVKGVEKGDVRLMPMGNRLADFMERKGLF